MITRNYKSSLWMDGYAQACKVLKLAGEEFPQEYADVPGLKLLLGLELKFLEQSLKQQINESI